ncbi:MAG: IS30 family transposase [Clostridiales bacterium]|nr:IS30 family transposase [Clostridiales bacterium]
MPKYKHLSLDERITIEKMLKSSYSFKAIGRELGRDCTSISKEVRNHIIFRKTGSYGRSFNNCIHRFTCDKSYICDFPKCHNRYCRFCERCTKECNDFQEEICNRLSKPPYICNGCDKLRNCTLQKSFYYAADAHKEYEMVRSEARSGISADENEIARLDSIISPLILKGQSINHICSSKRDIIMHSDKTIYNYLDYNLFSARNIDLVRKVKYRPRKKSTTRFKVDKSCRIGRTYEDFLLFMKEHPDTPIVQMDSVEGTKGGKVLLTIHFTDPLFMLAFLRVSNTSQSVIDIFERLYWELRPDVFTKLFPVILTDNGSEFSNPAAIEFDKEGNRRTHIFYCDPSAPYQKGAIESNHALIRRIIPKGKSMNQYTQEDINLMMNHINSYGRKKLNNRSPHQAFNFLHGAEILRKFGSYLIPNDDIILLPELLK